MPATKAPSEKTVIAARTIKRGRPRGFTTGSLAEQVDRMAVGESISLSQRFELADKESDPATMKAATNNMRSQLSAYAARVAEMNDGLDDREYRTESGSFITDDKTAVVVSVVLTRFG